MWYSILVMGERINYGSMADSLNSLKGRKDVSWKFLGKQVQKALYIQKASQKALVGRQIKMSICYFRHQISNDQIFKINCVSERVRKLVLCFFIDKNVSLGAIWQHLSQIQFTCPLIHAVYFRSLSRTVWSRTRMFITTYFQQQPQTS